MNDCNQHAEMNETLRAFGAPQSLVRDYRHWSLLLRPQQVTLGSLALVAKGPATAFSALAPDAFSELSRVTSELEPALKQAFAYDKLNYLMLMMVDPHVHFHIIPRYAAMRELHGHEFTDEGWPGPPRLDIHTHTDGAMKDAIRAELLRHWP
ncbi:MULTISPECIES: HIT family protein [Halomonas]|uniref:Diadenosine tetraphosphate (Ap4A) HIT family hydrolase n=1 Tax=Halomonas ventosae TaxID=229007 RepID=A0A4R6HHT5_9GAMM|nr:HIT family protein [Halomonas ventosae]TDO07738.1 diadenosine tetraphosphate (Ap4A) HIT family hydrolase [Halomonas ventosae]